MYTFVTSIKVGGVNEHRFKTAAEMAAWVWANCPYVFAGLKKTEQRD